MNYQHTSGRSVLVHMVTHDDRPACNPAMPDMVQTPGYPLHPGYQRTNEPRAVTCPMCKQTAVYKVAMEPYR